VLAEALDLGILDRLSAPELAAALSSLAYEARGTAPAPSFRWPSARVRRATSALQTIAATMRNLEQARLDHFLTREPDPSFAATVYGWAAGDPLDVVLGEDITGGDFVRSMRQVVDL
jgi:ATP-dependent RNA helicase HelY